MEQLGGDPGHTIELQVQASSVPPKGEAPGNLHSQEVGVVTTGTHSMPGTFVVQVPVGREVKEVLVKVEKAKSKKPFLGGYKHKVTGVEYHHASTQTLPKRVDSKV